MPEFDSKNRHFHKLMEKSNLKMPFSDFEENVILRMQKESFKRESLSIDNKLSIFFFVLGTVVGFTLNFILRDTKQTFLGFSSENALLIFQIAFVTFFFTQFETYVKIWKKIFKWNI